MKDLKQMTPEELNNLAKELYQMKEHSEVLTSALSTLRARLLCKADGMVEAGEPVTKETSYPPLLLPTQRKELVTRFPELYGKHPNVLDVDELRNEVLKLQARLYQETCKQPKAETPENKFNDANVVTHEAFLEYRKSMDLRLSAGEHRLQEHGEGLRKVLDQCEALKSQTTELTENFVMDFKGLTQRINALKGELHEFGNKVTRPLSDHANTLAELNCFASNADTRATSIEVKVEELEGQLAILNKQLLGLESNALSAGYVSGVSSTQPNLDTEKVKEGGEPTPVQTEVPPSDTIMLFFEKEHCTYYEGLCNLLRSLGKTDKDRLIQWLNRELYLPLVKHGDKNRFLVFERGSWPKLESFGISTDTDGDDSYSSMESFVAQNFEPLLGVAFDGYSGNVVVYLKQTER